MLFYTVNVYCDFTSIYTYTYTHIYIYILIVFHSSCQFPVVFLHVCCIPHQNSQWLFWASVWFMLDSSRWHEPFGECFSKQNVDVTTRCLNLHFWISNSFKYSETVVQFTASHRSVEWALKQLAAVCIQFFQMIRLTVTVSLQPRQPSFFNIARAISAAGNCNMRIPGTGHACRYGDSYFLVVGEVQLCT